MSQRKLAIFDIDGTIFRKNLSFELINELSWMKIFPKSVREELVKHYSNWLDHEGTYEEYRRALVDLYNENIKGCKREDIIEASRKVVPFYKNNIQNDLEENQNILVVASHNSLRALVKYLEKISDENIIKLEIPTGSLRLYEVNKGLVKLIRE